jgi:hypothetical protein
MDSEITSLGCDEKRALLAEVLRRRAAQPLRAPLSPGQERIWRLLALEPDSPVYNLGFAYNLRGPLDAGALEQALVALARRHEALRTAFAVIDGVPMQVIAPEASVRFERVDLRSVVEADFPAEARRVAGVAARAPIDLTRAPLWRFTLLERSDFERALLITTHHIISDRWSVGLLVQELAAEYKARLEDGPSPLTSPAESYREATRRLEAAITDDERRRQLAYWSTVFSGEIRDVILPADARPSGESGYRGVRRTFAWPADSSARLKELAAGERTTPYVVLVAALAAYLHGETGQRDLVFTTPESGRHHAATRGVVGYFNNLLPLRLSVSPGSDFRT